MARAGVRQKMYHIRPQTQWRELAYKIPMGAVVMGADYDYSTRSTKICVEHESYPMVPEYQVLPVEWL